MRTLPNKHEDDAKTARVINAKKVNTNGHVKKNTVRIQKDSNMLCYATAERSSNVTYYNAEEIIVQEHSAFTSRGKKTVPGIASTLPRARERGAKAYLRDGDARKANLVDPKVTANSGGNTVEATASTQPELQKNFLQSTICKIGNHP